MIIQKDIEKYLGERRGVIHVGAHEGQERDWYGKQGFKYVSWFEPNPIVFHKLQKNIEDQPFHTAYNIGIHDVLQESVFHVANGDGQSSSILPFGSHKKYHPEVKYEYDINISLLRLDEIINEEVMESFNFLNIDTQGVELNVIKSLGKLVSKLDYIYTEVNEEEVYLGCSLITDIDEYLKPFGFYRIKTKIYKKCHWGDAFYKRY